MSIAVHVPYPAGAVGPMPPLTGMVYWLKADAITGLSDSDLVASWLDSSGNGHPATQGTSGERPIYKTATLNGLPVVRFDGVDDSLVVGDFSAIITAAATWYCVATIRNSGSFKLFSHEAHDAYSRLGASGSGYWSSFRSLRYEAYPSVGPTNGNRLLSARTSTSVELEVFYAGVSQGLATANGSMFSGGLTHTIGNEPERARYLDGDVAELIVYSVFHDNTTRASIEAYLASKWGV